MKLDCSQAELNSALQLVSRAVASRPTHPVLGNVLLTADEGTGRLSLTGFDLNLGIQTSLDASVTASGAITLPAKLLVEIVSKLSNESPVTFEIKEDRQLVELKSLNGSYQMRGMSAEDFPELPLVQNGLPLKVTAKNLLKALRGTIFASSTDEAKQLLTGVNLNFQSNSMEAAATDGHRLAVLNMSQALDNQESEKFSVTLPSRSLREVERLVSTWKDSDIVSLFFDKGQVVFLASEQVVTSRTLEGSYPNYSQLLPDEFSRSIEIERSPFIKALERVAVLADQHNNVVKLTIESSSLTITADVQDVGRGSESLPISFDGDSIQIAFNVRYVLDGLKAINSESVLLQCNLPTTPAIITPLNSESDFTYLVMPVQIRS